MHKLGVIGAGHMGMTLLDGVIRLGMLNPREITVFELSPERLEAARERGFSIAESERAIYEGCPYVLISVLPQNIETVLERLSECAPVPKPVIISIVSGTASSFFRRYLGEDVPVVCAVPNLTLSVGKGATAIARTENVPDAVFERIVHLFDGLGCTSVLDEKMLREVIAVNGCAPGYAFYFINAMAKTVEKRGINYETAVELAASSLAGAAQMILDGKGSPQALLKQVCSPGGLTAEGVAYFDDHGLSDIMQDGMMASVLRGYALSRI